MRPICTVAFFPNNPRWDANPYLPLLRQALIEEGVEIAAARGDYLSARHLWADRDQIDVLHFHWIQYHYLVAPGRGSATVLINFVRNLIWARALGYRIVWTMHNLLPHEPVPGKLDLIARWAMVWLAHAVLVLCEAGRQELAQRFGRRRDVYVAPLGTYVGAHPSGITQAEARVELALRPDQFIYFSFGSIRPYKGIERLLDTFGSLPGDNLRLLVAGRPQSDDLGQLLKRVSNQDARIRMELTFLPDDRLQVYMAASDVVVLPFETVMSSSSVLAAMSFGKPLIVPALGCLPEWVLPECGILYDSDDEVGLRWAMLKAQQTDLSEMGQLAYQHVLTFSWKAAAKDTLRAYLGH